jgi:hypothetical protein
VGGEQIDLREKPLLLSFNAVVGVRGCVETRSDSRRSGSATSCTAGSTSSSSRCIGFVLQPFVQGIQLRGVVSFALFQLYLETQIIKFLYNLLLRQLCVCLYR